MGALNSRSAGRPCLAVTRICDGLSETTQARRVNARGVAQRTRCTAIVVSGRSSARLQNFENAESAMDYEGCPGNRYRRGTAGLRSPSAAPSKVVGSARAVCWRLDRLGRNLRHLVVLLEELRAVGVAFVSLNEGIDATTPAGKLQLHVLAALAEFERERTRERVHAGLARARAQGTRLGRPRNAPSTIAVPGGSVRAAALVWGVSKPTAARWIVTCRTSAPLDAADSDAA